MLRSVCKLNKQIIADNQDEYSQEQIEVKELRQELIKQLDIPNANNDVLYNVKKRVLIEFRKADKDGSGNITKAEFCSYLKSLQLKNYTIRSLDLIWDAIDENMDGGIGSDELFVLIFPQYKKEFKGSIILF